MDPEYDLFLSHAREDTPWSKALAERLKAEGVRVWFDGWEIKAGDNIVDRINHGLSHSRQMAAVWTRVYFDPDKQWTDAEINTRQYADSLGSKRLLIPLLREDRCEIPPLLAPLKTIDFRDDAQFGEALRELIGALLPASLRVPASAAVERETAHATSKEIPRSSPDDPFQKWMEFLATLVGVLILFAGMLIFGIVLVFHNALYPGIACVIVSFAAAVGMICWLVARSRRGAPVGRQEFAFIINAAEQIRAHHRSAEAASLAFR